MTLKSRMLSWLFTCDDKFVFISSLIYFTSKFLRSIDKCEIQDCETHHQNRIVPSVKKITKHGLFAVRFLLSTYVGIFQPSSILIACADGLFGCSSFADWRLSIEVFVVTSYLYTYIDFKSLAEGQVNGLQLLAEHWLMIVSQYFAEPENYFYTVDFCQDLTNFFPTLYPWLLPTFRKDFCRIDVATVYVFYDMSQSKLAMSELAGWEWLEEIVFVVELFDHWSWLRRLESQWSSNDSLIDYLSHAKLFLF